MADPFPVDAPPALPVDTFLGSKALRRVLAAFTYRDFRVQWFGACTSSIGTWTQSAAQSWMILSLTKSPFYLGLDPFLQQLPIMLFTLIGGVLADRRDRRRTLLMSQYIQMATAAALGLLVVFDVVKIWHILALSFCTGLAQAFGGPAYQSLIPSLVDKKDLPNAIALNSIQFNVARGVGPLVFAATLAICASWGLSDPQAMAVCFFLNAISFLVVIYTLLSLRVKHIPSVAVTRMRDELRGGLAYVRNHGSLVSLIVFAAMTTFLGFAVLTLLPIFAERVFHGGAGTYSQLMIASGAGAVFGALVIAWLGQFKRMGRTALFMQATYGLLIVAFAASQYLWLSLVLLFLIGATQMMVFSSATSLVQLIAPNEMRGRVVSIYMLAFRGGMPIGSLVSGYLATFIAPPLVIALNGGLLIVIAGYFLARSHGIRDL